MKKLNGRFFCVILSIDIFVELCYNIIVVLCQISKEKEI